MPLDGVERHPGCRLPCGLGFDIWIPQGDNREINSQQAGAMEHRYDSVNPLQFLLGNVQPEVEGLGELGSDLLAGSGCHVCVGFEEDL